MPEPVKSEDINAQNDPSVARQWDDKTPMEQKFEELYKICDDLKVGLLGTYRKNIGVRIPLHVVLYNISDMLYSQSHAVWPLPSAADQTSSSLPTTTAKSSQT